MEELRHTENQGHSREKTSDLTLKSGYQGVESGAQSSHHRGDHAPQLVTPQR